MPVSTTSNPQWRPVAMLIAIATVVALALSLRFPGADNVVVAPTAVRQASVPAAHLYAVMINGGGSKEQNYHSHLLHVQQMLTLLRQTGVGLDHIAIFDADGADETPDLATRAQQSESDFWLVEGTQAEPALGAPITYVNSAIPEVTLQPATLSALGAWFDDAATRLHAGDTLLVYVTDHGTKNRDDVTNNRIVLWGSDESLSVNALRDLLDKLDPDVRVVALMSQCFSGAFAHLADVHTRADGLRSAAVCGYFSSSAERFAYGCYPENRGRDNVGHSFHFIQELATTGNMLDAQARVLVADATPDVPLTTSDTFLHDVLSRVASGPGADFDTLVDALLSEAWRTKAAWEPEIRLLDRIGTAFGSFSPRSLRELAEQTKNLPDISAHLKTVSSTWQMALADANTANLSRFLAAQPVWAEQLKAAPSADAADTPPLATAFLGALTPFTRAEGALGERVETLHEKSRAAAAANYRMEVRLAVVLRLRTILTSIAGRVYMATHATPNEREAYDALVRCEDLGLPAIPLTHATLTTPAPPFPPFADEVKDAQAALPAWMGIQFRDTKQPTRDALDLAEGAATVMTVYPQSPAQQAGLQPGDIVTGPPGAPFRERNEIRASTMLAKLGEPRTLDVIRDAQHLQVTLLPEPYPLKWPALPGPPKIGSVAPALGVTPYRGTLPAALAAETPHLLFFWATWCAPCKASLPEVLAFETQRGVPVIAITDEPSEQLDAFFQKFPHPFPQTVAIDEIRRAFVVYGVSGTPTFVLIGADGRVQSSSTGYGGETGLGIEGWHFGGG